jgi:hypothetical protein
MATLLEILPETHMMSFVFRILVAIQSDILTLETAVSCFDYLQQVFSESSWLESQKALVYYNHRSTLCYFWSMLTHTNLILRL